MIWTNARDIQWAQIAEELRGVLEDELRERYQEFVRDCEEIDSLEAQHEARL